ncbi:MAG: L,D-transpeptidase [Bacteroidota bacterium]|nr:L,D-transpeptidase [Bacteroidota bacterium]MDP4233349.1 L,D-transpeptidase [Bacteroidota bacterium]MDP4242216.1 L,D-transpeptidase [Bacteroidota bacterium]MDP4286972.1 L,D-transpeptidase [Bacteroidota bacterium]
MIVGFSSCTTKTHNGTAFDSSTTRTYNASAPTSPAVVAVNYPVTLPVLDAFMADSTFDSLAKARTGLTDTELLRVRRIAHDEAARLEKTQMANTGDYSGSTADAKARAISLLDSIIGADKRTKLFAFVQEEWSDRADATGGTAATDTNSMEGTRNAVPKDSRVVVNIPAYRMDVFDSGNLVKSYEVTIGYPEFPLPTGMRKAREILFNPTWTPPDESWVESPNGKVKVGQKIAAGDKLNPLGVLKIPIGEPSLIHGGKSPAKLGTFGSHGCVGLVDRDATDFAPRLAQLSGKTLSDSAVASYEKDKKSTYNVRLPKSVAIELRYETIVADSGQLHIYRDVYDHNTNTQENLDATLMTYGLSMKDLTLDEQSMVLVALHEMSKDITTNTDTNIVRDIALKDTSGNESPNKESTSHRNIDHRPAMTRRIKGQKEIIIPIAALRGRGYPQPVGMAQPLAVKTKIAKRK